MGEIAWWLDGLCILEKRLQATINKHHVLLLDITRISIKINPAILNMVCPTFPTPQWRQCAIACTFILAPGLFALVIGLVHLHDQVECSPGDPCQSFYNSTLSPCAVAQCKHDQCVVFSYDQLMCEDALNSDAVGMVILGAFFVGMTLLVGLLMFIASACPQVKAYSGRLKFAIAFILFLGGLVYNAFLVFKPHYFDCGDSGLFCSYYDTLDNNHPCFIAHCHPEQCVSVGAKDTWKCTGLGSPVWYYINSLIFILQSYLSFNCTTRLCNRGYVEVPGGSSTV